MARGILFLGESGSGKSRLALSLLYEGARLVADDVVEIYPFPGGVMGRAPEKTRGLVEIRGVGIIDVGESLGAPFVIDETPIDLVVELLGGDADDRRRAAVDVTTTALLGRDIPRIRVGAGVDVRGLISVVGDVILGGTLRGGRVRDLMGTPE
jgi:HPr kinase/phosphorylase